MNERPIPPAALRDQNSVEILRVWVAEQQLHSSLKIGMYRQMKIQEDVAWGTILADTARHVARALSEEGEESESTLLRKIIDQLNAEIGTPSSGITGGFVES